MAAARLKRERGIAVALVAAAALLALIAPSPASASTIFVNDRDDSSGNGAICTLRDAINSANNNSVFGGCTAGQGGPTVDRIDLTPISGQVIMLGSALPMLTSSMEIFGPESGTLSITGDDQYRPFSLNSAAVVTISSLTIEHGLAGAGGAIDNTGTLTLNGVVVRDSKAQVTGGMDAFPEAGAILNAGGTLHLILSTITQNSAIATGASNQNAPEGGAIFSSGTLTVDRSVISGNQATADAQGGTSTNAVGGGIDVSGGSASFVQSVVSGNTASATNGVGTNTAQGGGIATSNSSGLTLTLDRTTVSGNTSNAGTPGTDAAAGGIEASGFGGASFTVTSSTIAGNSAPVDANIRFGPPTSTFKNTIVSNPLGGGLNCGLPHPTSVGFNLEDADSCGFNQSTDKPSTNPMLAPTLADNGGSTPTLALLTGSPAIDAGQSSAGETFDQRGLSRPSDFASIPNVGDGSDIGAFEVQVPVPVTTPPSTISPAPTKKCKKRKHRAAAAKKKCKRRKR